MVPQESKLLSMLSNNNVTFFIPPYQRNYEWTDDQCRVFLEDVKKTYDSNVEGIRSEHFFGSVTYFKTESVFGQPDKLVLIDGQQRITTTMLFLVALRDILDDNSVQQFIDSKYLKNDNVQGDTEYKIKLKQVETDWTAYKNLILKEELSDKEKNSAVYRNYQFFTNKLNELKAANIPISALIEKGLDKFSVITIELQPEKNPWENPQEIFESMNSLGKPLSLADLVRNYLLLGLDADTQSMLYKDYWLKMEETIPSNVSNFIRDYMQAKEKRSFPKATDANYKELYSTFKKIFAGCDAGSLLKDFKEASEIYAAILPGGSIKNDRIDKELNDLNTMNVTTAYSFLLELLRMWKNDEFSEQAIVDILTAFRIYCMRKRLLGLAAAENKNFPQLVRKLPDLKESKNKKEKMFEILANQETNLRLPNDIELSRHLQTMNFYNFRYCKFFLALIEETITKHRPDLTEKVLQIEHIMPQTLNEAWEKELGPDYEEIHQTYLHTIGNLTLIRHNQELGNDPFNDKKKIYINNAGLQIAKTKITSQEHWRKTDIESRAEWIIDYLLQNVLPIPDKMRKINNFVIKQGSGLSFQELQLIGLDINFIDDTNIVAHVVADKEVEFEGKRWRLSPLTREIYTRKGTGNASGSYQGAQYWAYDGIRLADIM